MKHTILVTGAAGFIGFHVSKLLLERGGRVVSLDNLNDYYDPALKQARLNILTEFPSFEFVRADIADQTAVNTVFEKNKFNFVIHLAAQAGVNYSLENPAAYIKSNIIGFFNVLEAVRKNFLSSNANCRLIFASSSSVYGGDSCEPFDETQSCNAPLSIYAATKKADEVLAHSYSHIYRIPAIGLRFFTVYGPWGRPDMSYFKFADGISKGHEITIKGDDSVARDFTYVDDAAQAVVSLVDGMPNLLAEMGEKIPYRVYNISDGRKVLLSELLGQIEKNLGARARVVRKNLGSVEVHSTFANIESFECDIGPINKTPLATGVKNFVEWFRKYTAFGPSAREDVFEDMRSVLV